MTADEAIEAARLVKALAELSELQLWLENTTSDDDDVGLELGCEYGDSGSSGADCYVLAGKNLIGEALETLGRGMEARLIELGVELEVAP